MKLPPFPGRQLYYNGQTIHLYFLIHIKELYISTGMETRQLFCRMFVTLKIIKELFVSTLNGIPASVSFVFLTLVVLNAR